MRLSYQGADDFRLVGGFYRVEVVIKSVVPQADFQPSLPPYVLKLSEGT